jgi:hypothetical protein
MKAHRPEIYQELLTHFKNEGEAVLVVTVFKGTFMPKMLYCDTSHPRRLHHYMDVKTNLYFRTWMFIAKDALLRYLAVYMEVLRDACGETK